MDEFVINTSTLWECTGRLSFNNKKVYNQIDKCFKQEIKDNLDLKWITKKIIECTNKEYYIITLKNSNLDSILVPYAVGLFRYQYKKPESNDTITIILIDEKRSISTIDLNTDAALV